MLSQGLIQFKAHKNKWLCKAKKKKWQRDKRKQFCANACEYLRNKQVEVAKVFENTEDCIEFGRRV